MSTNSFGQAFHQLLSIHSRTITLERKGHQTVTIKATPSNYYRNGAGPDEVVVEGREFVISAEALTKAGWTQGALKRGDRIIDADLGTLMIVEPREMFGFGGSIIGYRVRTN